MEQQEYTVQESGVDFSARVLPQTSLTAVPVFEINFRLTCTSHGQSRCIVDVICEVESRAATGYLMRGLNTMAEKHLEAEARCTSPSTRNHRPEILDRKHHGGDALGGRCKAHAKPYIMKTWNPKRTTLYWTLLSQTLNL
jgi:hypothetical protein